jgi:HK97 family phage major capsid protein/HK97 family phage prohead protease
MKDLLIKSQGDAFEIGNRQIPKTNYRELTLENRAVVSDERTIDLSVSSDQPYKRWWYYEILDHSEESVDLSRMNDGAMSLYNHNRDQYLGVVERAWLEDGKLYNSIRFDDHELAEKIVKSINNGIVKNVSIGYRVEEIVLVKKSDDDLDTYKATRWTPFESSFVTVPADATVGVGRQYFALTKDKEPNWEELEQRIAKKIYQNFSQELEMAQEVQGTLIETINETDIRQQERDRITAINAAGAKYGCVEIAQKAIDTGLSLEQARNLFADQVLSKSNEPVAQPLQPLGFSQKEKESYSVRKAILFKMGQISEKEAGLEFEASRAIAEKLGKPPEGIYIPTRDLAWSNTRATYATGAAGTGGSTVETDLLSENFIEALRSQLVMRKLGATILSGLEGNIDIPRQASVAGTAWVGESALIPQGESTFDKISLSPKTVATRSIYTRNMLLQSSIDIEAFIRQDLVTGLSLEIDRAAINGNGIGGQPLGIVNYPGVGAVVIGANGGAPTWQNIVDLESRVATADALNGTCYYLTNCKVRGKLKTTEKANATGMFIWENDRNMGNMGSVNGYGAAVTNQVPGNLTKGTGTNLSIAIFGDFSSVIIGEWGILDLLPNPFGTGYEQGNVQVRAMQSVDLNIRRPQFLSVCSDINTI